MSDKLQQKLFAAQRSKLRKKLFIDPRVQGTLVVRAVSYCLLNSVFLLAGFVMWQLYAGRSRPQDWQNLDLSTGFVPALFATLCVVPLVIIDSLRTSNRFAGPMYRLRRSIRKLARGEAVEPIIFRDNDYWHEVAEEFNAAVARIERDKITAAQGKAALIPPSLYPIEVD